MADQNFKNDSKLTFEVQWDEELGQPLLKCTNTDAPPDPYLGAKDTATDTTETDQRSQTTVTVVITAQDAFSPCNVYDYDGQPPPWANNEKTITLEIGDEDHEITFTVAVDTKNPTGTKPKAGWKDSWRLKSPSDETKADGADDDTVTTWVLDPYIRLTRTGYHIKAT